MGQITEDFVQRAMRCCQLGQHPSLTVWETRQLLTAWVEWQGCRDERDKLDEANRICEQWRQWTVATRAENEALRARVADGDVVRGDLQTVADVLRDYEGETVWQQAQAAVARVAELEADVRDARGLLRGMIDAKDGRVARFLIERAERFIERAAGNKEESRNA